MIDNKILPVSIVIPTLGGEGLSKTISLINNDIIKPFEIIICIPNEYANNINFTIASNVLVVYTEKKGQVYQRSLGFSQAKSQYVLQLDDDLKISIHDIAILIEELKLKGNKSWTSIL